MTTDTGRAPVRPEPALTVPARLARQAAEHPFEVAHVCGDRQLTFAEWGARANAAARGLSELGVRRGDRVVIQCRATGWIDYVVAYTAVVTLGAVAVPIRRDDGAHHLRYAIAEASPVGLIGDVADVADHMWVASLASLEDGRSSAPLDVPVDPSDDVEILFTSGTTGGPKGVVASHANVLHTHRDRPGPLRVVLHALPLGGLGASGLVILPLGGSPYRVITLPRYDDAALVDAIARHGVTDVILVPTSARSLLASDAAAALDPSTVRLVRLISAPSSAAERARLAALFPAAEIDNMLSTTEAWPARAVMRFGPDRPDSLGKSHHSGSIRIVDEQGTPLPAGMSGHVQLRMVGAPRRRYLNDPQATAAVFAPRGWIYTGDIGVMDDDEYLYLIDRATDLVVISGGLNVSTIEVEDVLREHPGVRDAAAVGLPHDTLGQYVAAAVVANPGLDVDELAAYLLAQLGPLKAPRRVVLVDALPRNALQKVVKGQVRALLALSAARLGVDVDAPQRVEPPAQRTTEPPVARAARGEA